jgi:hypothetical protein
LPQRKIKKGDKMTDVNLTGLTGFGNQDFMTSNSEAPTPIPGAGSEEIVSPALGTGTEEAPTTPKDYLPSSTGESSGFEGEGTGSGSTLEESDLTVFKGEIPGWTPHTHGSAKPPGDNGGQNGGQPGSA